METNKANKIDNTKDVKTGQTGEMRVDNAFYEKYANMSAEEVAKLRQQRQSRTSFSGKVLNTYIPPEFKHSNLHYEWIVCDEIAIEQKIKNGWVVVSDEKLAKMKGCSTSSRITIPSGMHNKRGEPEQLILLAIHKSIYDADVLAKKQKMIDFSSNIDSGKSIVDTDGKQTTADLQLKEISVE